MDLTGEPRPAVGRPPGPRRGPKPALTHDLIARAGIAIADAEGLAARVDAAGRRRPRLHRRCPCTATCPARPNSSRSWSTWRWARPPPTWRDRRLARRLRAWALALLPGFLRHPWALEATTGPRVVGPNELGWMEAALAVLDGTGLGGGERMDVLAVLAGHVRSIAQQATTPDGDPGTQFGAILVEVVRERGDRYPAVKAALADRRPRAARTRPSASASTSSSTACAPESAPSPDKPARPDNP